MSGQRSIHLQFCIGAIATLILVAGCGTSSPSATSEEPSSDVIQRTSEKGPVKLSVRISPAEPRLSDLVEMDIEVNAQPNVEIRPPAFGEAVGDFLVRDYTERSPRATTKTESAETDATTRVFHYQLEPASSGTHLIRSIAIEFVDNRPSSESRGKTSMIESEPIEIKVTTELGDQVPDLANLEPMLPPQPIDQSTTLWWLMGLIFAIVTAALVLRFRRKKHQNTKPVYQPTPEEIAQKALAELLSEGLPRQGLFKEFYVRLTGIVRIYIEGTTGLRAPEQTTEEFLREMRSREIFPAERSLRLKEFLEAADMVKYAGQQPEDEQIELSILRAKEFIAST